MYKIIFYIMIDGGIMAENYNGMAVGIFELDSLAACFVALDAASKAANVKIQNVERNRLGAGAMRKNAWICIRCNCCNGCSP